MKMKQKKCKGFLLAMLGCLMLTGCGEAPYELTEEEQQLIVSYSAHVVSKFNTFQKDGLTYVPEIKEEVIDTQTPPETEKESEVQSGNTDMQIGGGENTTNTETEIQGEKATMDSVFADLGLTFTYLGNEVTASYMQDAMYAVNPGIGKNLLVLKFNVENLTEEAILVDNLTAGDAYSAKYIMDTGTTYHAKAVMTLLINDFTTYEGAFEAQESKEMVIVFEIPQDTVIVDAVELKITRNGSVFQINL